MRARVQALGLALALLSAAPAAAQDGRACTQIGCTSGIFFNAPSLDRTHARWHSVTVCVQERCRRSLRQRGARPQVFVLEHPRLTGPRTVRVRFVVRDRRGKRLLRAERRVALRRTQPNGPECEPVCWQAALSLVRGRLVVEQ